MMIVFELKGVQSIHYYNSQNVDFVRIRTDRIDGKMLREKDTIGPVLLKFKKGGLKYYSKVIVIMIRHEAIGCFLEVTEDFEGWERINRR